MDTLLCDELLQEIFTTLISQTPSSSSSISLVSKRWLNLYRTSKTSLSLTIANPQNSQIPIFSTLLSHYPFLSSLSLTFSQTPISSDQFITVIFTSPFSSHLRHFRSLPSPISISSLNSFSKSCSNLVSLTVAVSRPVFFNWVVNFRALKTLGISICGEFDKPHFGNFVETDNEIGDSDVELSIEMLHLSGIRKDDSGIEWLWRNCKKLKKLQLKNCEGIGNFCSYSFFDNCLHNLEDIELRTCRTIVDPVLTKISEICINLSSILIYDGCSKEALLQFIRTCRSNAIKKLDFRLPLDLNNDHLLAIAQRFNGLSSLRLESCCLVTGDGLKILGSSISSKIQELALINCDVIEREPGLLTTLVQNLKSLKRLDLSHNEMMLDKEFVLMLGSCDRLIDLRLKGCKGLSNVAMNGLLKSCRVLEKLDVMNCGGIDMNGVEFFVVNSKARLRQIRVEEKKVSSNAMIWASCKFIEFVFV